MASEYSGGGDPVRSLELLWGAERRQRRGPRPSLDVDRIVTTAIEVADAGGLEALTVRRVADQLGVGAMSLYTYVPGKAELLDLMLDRVLGEVRQPSPELGWRAALELRAREDWAMYHRHPWVLQVSGTRALLGPNETQLFEASVACLKGTGLRGREMVLVVTLVGEYTRGAARTAVDAAQAEARTGISDEDWWAARAPVFAKYFDADRYPTVVGLAAEDAFQESQGGRDYTLRQAVEGFDFGLARVLDGIEAFVRRRQGED